MIRQFLTKKRYGRKMFAGFLAAAALLGSLCLNTVAGAADQMPDLAAGQNGKLTVKLVKTVESEENPKEIQKIQVKEGAKVLLYKVADLTVNDGSAKYTLTSSFRALAATVKFDGMNASGSSVAAAALKKSAEADKITGRSAATDAEGTVVFDNLEPGMYLIYRPESDVTEEKDDQNIFSPFLVSVPISQENETAKEWNYSVEAFPKLADKNIIPETPPTETPPTETPPTEPPKPDSPKPDNPTPSNPPSSGGNTPSKPIKTGDDTNLYLWRWLLLISMSVITVIFTVKRRTEKEE